MDGAPKRRRLPRLDEDARAGLSLLALMAVAMWIIEAVDQVVAGRLDRHGIQPQDPDGLAGVVSAPFLHGGWDHLIGNTVPFLALGAAIAVTGLARMVVATVLIAAIGGAGTWLVAPANTVHIGASGLVFGYATYVVSRGAFTRRLWQLFVGAVVVVIWGTTLLRGLVPEDGISWQGHLFGAVGGVVAAWLVARHDKRGAEKQPAERDPLAL